MGSEKKKTKGCEGEKAEGPTTILRPVDARLKKTVQEKNHPQHQLMIGKEEERKGRNWPGKTRNLHASVLSAGTGGYAPHVPVQEGDNQKGNTITRWGEN